MNTQPDLKDNDAPYTQEIIELLKGNIIGFFWQLLIIFALAAIVVIKGTADQAVVYGVFFFPFLIYLLYLRFIKIRKGSLYLAKHKKGIYDHSLDFELAERGFWK